MKLYPSILTFSKTKFQKQLDWAIESQVIEVIQVDVVDGYFADNLTLSPLNIAQIDYGDLQLDLHLMTEEPMDFVREIVALKEYLPVRAVIAQVERMSHQGEFLAEIKKYSWKAGLSLDLYTPVEAIDPESWQDLDIVQLMTIRAGFQSQEFKQNALEKLVEIRQLAKSDVEIIVDGGVKIEYIELLAEAEVDGVTVGSGLWRATNPIQAIKEYSQLMDQTNND